MKSLVNSLHSMTQGLSTLEDRPAILAANMLTLLQFSAVPTKKRRNDPRAKSVAFVFLVRGLGIFFRQKEAMYSIHLIHGIWKIVVDTSPWHHWVAWQWHQWQMTCLPVTRTSISQPEPQQLAGLTSRKKPPQSKPQLSSPAIFMLEGFCNLDSRMCFLPNPTI